MIVAKIAENEGKKRANRGLRAKEKKNFWQKMPRPFFVLAPMANVTDSVFRKMIAKYGKPHAIWTEFVSADGLVSPGKKKLLNDLVYSEKERPIVAQIFGSHPESIRKAAELIAKLGFDGLDINMGCPDRSVERQGGGAAMIRNPQAAAGIIEAARAGVKGRIPVSVKTRIGYNKIDLEWLRFILGQKLPALTVHLRTRKEMSNAPAHWDLMGQIIKLRDEISRETLIIGNGDVETVEMGAEYIRKYGCDGIMIGRGIFGRPWLFCESGAKTPLFRLKVLVEHTKLFEKELKRMKNFDLMKKHFKAYVSGWDGAKELRVKLMGTHSAKEVEKVVKEYLAEKR